MKVTRIYDVKDTRIDDMKDTRIDEYNRYLLTNK